jgi:type I restriction enzyme M protein
LGKFFARNLLILHREDPNVYRKIDHLPYVNQTLAEVIDEQITIDELTKRNKLVSERLSLKEVILDLENLVLANAGVDAFEEVFKLVYAKLYDEYTAENDPRRKRLVKFRAAGETHRELYDKINGLFKDAIKQWKGVFLPGEKIDLTESHLAVCVSFLQDVKLFNSNLQVIDEAFEYLVTQVSKGSKGQYFTVRPVIDMAVKMLNPKVYEYVIDTAAGSCGFTMHSIFHVWGGELTAQKPERWQTDYAAEKVFALDFDPRSVKIAKAINLIAGDGRTNVFRVNTLDPRTWDEEARQKLKDHLYDFEDEKLNERNQESYRYFDFDLLLTNPPFAGDIKDSRILHQYELAKKWLAIDVESLTDSDKRDEYLANPYRHAYQSSGMWGTKQSRDVLFVERNLDFLKPGGRMAIVLPQGRLNNIGDGALRWWVSGKARILAVVGLHVNTFKPHTGTKTSVLFLQKFNDDPSSDTYCPTVEDYPIFFAVSQHPGKDNSGEYIYLKGLDGLPVLDLFGHKIIDHDLYDIHKAVRSQLERLLDRDQDDPKKCNKYLNHYHAILPFIPRYPTIAEAFEQFAKDQGFSFWQEA